MRLEVNTQRADRCDQAVIVFAWMRLGEVGVFPRRGRVAMGDLLLMPGDLCLMGNDPRLIGKDLGLGPLEDRERFQVVVTPTEMILALGQMLGMCGVGRGGHLKAFEGGVLVGMPAPRFTRRGAGAALAQVRTK